MRPVSNVSPQTQTDPPPREAGTRNPGLSALLERAAEPSRTRAGRARPREPLRRRKPLLEVVRADLSKREAREVHRVSGHPVDESVAHGPAEVVPGADPQFDAGAADLPGEDPGAPAAAHCPGFAQAGAGEDSVIGFHEFEHDVR